MTKFLKIWSILTDVKFLLALMGFIAIIAPVTAPFIAIQGAMLVQSIQGIGVGLIALASYLTESPKQKDEKYKGGKK